jgi:N-acetyl-gamma-glutamyl-phosphate reductase
MLRQLVSNGVSDAASRSITRRKERNRMISQLGQETPSQERPRSGATVAVAVYGASGTTGTELVGLLARHPHTHLTFATSRSYAGQSLRAVDPAAPEISLSDPADVKLDSVDIAFTCLPHGQAAGTVETIASSGVRVIDLSGDLRLRDEATHARVYGSPRSREVAERAVYGLTETVRERLGDARIVSNPGCYPTCSALPLLPFVRRGLIEGDVVIDAKSGVSGAGRAAKPLTHFCAAVDDVRPYALGRAHRHVAEIEQTLDDGARDGAGARIVFCPHVVPIERGMLATIVLSAPGVTAESALAICREDYDDEPFVDVLPAGEAARIRTVVRTNRAAIGVAAVEGTDRLVLTGAIDNLLKGAAGQAVQNMNVMLGLPETTGLEDPGMRAMRTDPREVTA